MVVNNTDLTSTVATFTHHKDAILCNDMIKVVIDYDEEKVHQDKLYLEESLRGVIELNIKKVQQYYRSVQLGSSARVKMSFISENANVGAHSMPHTFADEECSVLYANTLADMILETVTGDDRKKRSEIFPAQITFSVVKFDP